MILIGLGAKARQGKSYVANYMQEAVKSIVQYSFAEELKKECKAKHDELLPLWQAANNTKDVPVCKEDPIYGYTRILQWYGTDVIRKRNPNHWVEKVAERIQKEQPEIAIITDVRFPNEAEFIKANGGYLVEVIRVNEDGSRFLDSSRDPKHISETALDEYDGWNFIIRCKSDSLDALKYKSLGVLHAVIAVNNARIVSSDIAAEPHPETAPAGPIHGGTPKRNRKSPTPRKGSEAKV